jgi:hypothetical protein
MRRPSRVTFRRYSSFLSISFQSFNISHVLPIGNLPATPGEGQSYDPSGNLAAVAAGRFAKNAPASRGRIGLSRSAAP